MNSDIIELSYLQVLLGYVFVLFILFILKRRNISREKELIIATLRMTLQLLIVGFILVFLIENAHPLLTLSVILIMISFAVYTVFDKFKGQLSPSLKRVIMIALPSGGLIALFYFMFVVIQVTPYYNPQYFIPITGMIIGNSMTGISLGIHTMINRFTNDKAEVEEALFLGATPKDASENIINDAFDSAIMPTINNMLGMGIIFLPGMMTGQILSGVDPSTAILYQIGIMLGILGGVSLSTYFFLRLGYKTFFNASDQLISDNL